MNRFGLNGYCMNFGSNGISGSVFEYFGRQISSALNSTKRLLFTKYSKTYFLSVDLEGRGSLSGAPSRCIVIFLGVAAIVIK